MYNIIVEYVDCKMLHCVFYTIIVDYFNLLATFFGHTPCLCKYLFLFLCRIRTQSKYSMQR